MLIELQALALDRNIARREIKTLKIRDTTGRVDHKVGLEAFGTAVGHAQLPSLRPFRNMLS
jgi:hypothetical protein